MFHEHLGVSLDVGTGRLGLGDFAKLGLGHARFESVFDKGFLLTRDIGRT
jgi:hypothetical protein